MINVNDDMVAWEMMGPKCESRQMGGGKGREAKGGRGGAGEDEGALEGVSVLDDVCLSPVFSWQSRSNLTVSIFLSVVWFVLAGLFWTVCSGRTLILTMILIIVGYYFIVLIAL